MFPVKGGKETQKMVEKVEKETQKMEGRSLEEPLKQRPAQRRTAEVDRSVGAA